MADSENSKFFARESEALKYMERYKKLYPKRPIFIYKIKDSELMIKTDKKIKYDPKNPHATKYKYITETYKTEGWLVSHPMPKGVYNG